MSRSYSFLVGDGQPAQPRDGSPADSDSEDANRLLVTGWRRGFNKVEATKLLRGACGYDLAEAKAIVDRILESEPVEIAVPPYAEASEVARRLDALGADIEQ